MSLWRWTVWPTSFCTSWGSQSHVKTPAVIMKATTMKQSDVLMFITALYSSKERINDEVSD